MEIFIHSEYCLHGSYLPGHHAGGKPLEFGILVKNPGHFARARVHVWCGYVLRWANDLLDPLSNQKKPIKFLGLRYHIQI